MATTFVKEKKYKLDTSSIKGLLSDKSSFSQVLMILNILLAILCFILINFTNNIDAINHVVFIFLGNMVITYVAIFLSKGDRINNKEMLIKNQPDNEYLWHIGEEVKEFKGSGVKSLDKDNLKGKPLLEDVELVKRMGAVIGASGSGKTFQLKGTLEQQIAIGGGAFVVDGKGTLEELKNIYAIVGKYDRLDELYVLNFADPNNSNSVGFLNSGSALMLKEMLSELLDRSDAFWDGVADEMLSNVLKLLVYKRDNEGVFLSFSMMREYLNLSRLVDEVERYAEAAKNDVFLNDFISYMCVITDIDYNLLYKGNTIDSNFLNTINKMRQNSSSEKLQGVYNFKTGANRWNNVFTILGSNYKAIFGAEDPDFDLYDCVQTNKIIWVVLPTMESEDSARKIGKMILGQIKAVGNKKVKAGIPPKIPFVFFFDEYGSYGVVGFSNFISKSRGISMPCWFYFQDKAQLDKIDDGRGLETRELLGNITTLLVMKNSDAELTRLLSERVDEHVELERHQSLKRVGSHTEGLSAELNYSKEKKDAFRSTLFNGLKDGEMVTFVGKDFYKTVAKAQDDFDLTYEKNSTEPKFVLPKTFPKSKLSTKYFLDKREMLINSEIKNVLFS